MKKAMFLAGLLVLGLTACSVNVPAPSTTPPVAASVPTPKSKPPISSSLAASDSESTMPVDSGQVTVDSYKETEDRVQQEPENELSTVNSQLSTESNPPAPAQTQTPPQPQDPSPSPQAPAVEQPAPQPTPQPDPVPPPPPVPQTAYDAPYDVGVITADAASYGASLGMTWNDALTKDNSSWEAPISTSPVLSGENLRATIQTSINRVLAIQQDNGYQAGEFYFRLYIEANGAGEYALFFLMG